MKKNSTRQLLIDSAKDLFNQYGNKKVRIEDIVKKANLDIETFHKVFENKAEIVLEAYSQENESAVEAFRLVMIQNLSYAKRTNT